MTALSPQGSCKRTCARGILTHSGASTHSSSCQPPGLTSEAAQQDGEPQQEGLVHFGGRKEWVRAGSCRCLFIPLPGWASPGPARGGATSEPFQDCPAPRETGDSIISLSGQWGERDWRGKCWAWDFGCRVHFDVSSLHHTVGE